MRFCSLDLIFRFLAILGFLPFLGSIANAQWFGMGNSGLSAGINLSVQGTANLNPYATGFSSPFAFGYQGNGFAPSFYPGFMPTPPLTGYTGPGFVFPGTQFYNPSFNYCNSAIPCSFSCGRNQRFSRYYRDPDPRPVPGPNPRPKPNPRFVEKIDPIPVVTPIPKGNKDDPSPEPVPVPEDCEAEAVRKLLVIFPASYPALLGTLFEIAVQKMAVQGFGKKSKTFEDAAKKQLSELQAGLDKIKGSSELKENLVDAYLEYGVDADEKKIKELIGKAPEACYFNCQTRLLNESASAYLLALSQNPANEDAASEAKITPVDVAAIWAAENIRRIAAETDSSYSPHSKNGKLMQAGTRLALYRGIIEGGADLSKEKIESEIAGAQAEVANKFGEAFGVVKESLAACLAKNFNCENCGAEKAEEIKDIIHEKVLKAVLHRANRGTKLETPDPLQGKIDDIPFDYTNFRKGDVARWTCIKGSKVVDPCTFEEIQCPAHRAVDP